MVGKPSNSIFIFMAGVLLMAILLVTVIALKPLPRLIWNASESVPIGLYWIEYRQPNLGEIAVLKPPEWVQLIADERNYLPNFAWLLKPVLAAHGAVVCRFGPFVFIDGRFVVKALRHDKKHRLMPVWRGCRKLDSDHVFLLSRHRDSFDGRYFGPVELALIIGTAKRLF